MLRCQKMKILYLICLKKLGNKDNLVQKKNLSTDRLKKALTQLSITKKIVSALGSSTKLFERFLSFN